MRLWNSGYFYRVFSFSKRMRRRGINSKISELIEEILKEASDRFPMLLLEGMSWAFFLDRDFRKNIENFEGRYVFRTGKNPAEEYSATFRDGGMKVKEGGLEEWDVRITFQDAEGLKAFLFSKDNDMLNAVLENKVQTDGNLNYLYKFGFMARSLIEAVERIPTGRYQLPEAR